MKWPAQSPDFNPIEHAWSYLKKKLREYKIPPNGMEQLWERVEKEWNEIPAEVILILRKYHHLIKSPKTLLMSKLS